MVNYNLNIFKTFCTHRLVMGFVILCLWPSAKIYAGLSILGGSGLGGGIFEKQNQKLVVTGYQYFFNPSFSLPIDTKMSLHTGLALRQMKLGFVDAGVQKQATYNLYGLVLGVHVPISDRWGIYISQEHYFQTDYSVLAVNSVLLNDQAFQYTTLQLYKGSSAKGIHVNMMHDKIDGGFSKSSRYRTGIGVSFTQQNFTEESTQIRTSSSAISPKELLTNAEGVYTLKMLCLNFYIGLAI